MHVSDTNQPTVEHYTFDKVSSSYIYNHLVSYAWCPLHPGVGARATYIVGIISNPATIVPAITIQYDTPASML